MHAARCFRWGAVAGAAAVAFGAFGAHALRHTLPPADLDTFELGVRYQIYHAFALCLCGLAGPAFGGPAALRVAAHCFLWGTVAFSGSLYALALTHVTWVAMVTPIGGTLLLIGWLALALAVRPGTRA